MKKTTGVAVVLIAAILISTSVILSLSFRKRQRLILAYLPAAGIKAWPKVIALFKKKYSVDVTAIYGSSGFLLHQAYISKTGDVLGSATPVYMKKAIKMGIVLQNSVVTVACMEPAILFQDHRNYTLEDLLKPGIKIAMCDPVNCAVGRFIKYMLVKMGLWDKIKKNIVVYTENFAKLVTVLRLGEVDAALGWNVATKWYPSLGYTPLKGPMPYKPCITVGVLKFSKNKILSMKFVDFLKSKEVKGIFEKLGYEVVK